MSGGRFEYGQYRIGDIADEIERTIARMGKTDEYGNVFRVYPPQVVTAFRQAIYALRVAEIYAHRVDWLLSGDDDDESFLEQLAKDLGKAERPARVLGSAVVPPKASDFQPTSISPDWPKSIKAPK